jgi:dihydroneopterin aldolase
LRQLEVSLVHATTSAACACTTLQENTLGQKFVVDAVLWADIAKSGRTDHLDDTLDYRKVYRCASR